MSKHAFRQIVVHDIAPNVTQILFRCNKCGVWKSKEIIGDNNQSQTIIVGYGRSPITTDRNKMSCEKIDMCLEEILSKDWYRARDRKRIKLAKASFWVLDQWNEWINLGDKAPLIQTFDNVLDNVVNIMDAVRFVHYWQQHTYLTKEELDIKDIIE